MGGRRCASLLEQYSLFSMDAVLEADRLIKEANEAFDRTRQEFIDELDAEKAKIARRFDVLEARKRSLAEKRGNPDASPGDWVEVNCGGRVISARRSTLCQLEGTKFGALFSGLYEKKLPKDTEGRIFLDLCPDEFQAIVDYLTELSISSPDDLPTLPKESGCLAHLFGLGALFSNLINDAEFTALHEWLAEDGADGDFKMIYESDNYSGTEFSEHCKGVPRTVIVVETECGLKIGGYSSMPWRGAGEDFGSWERSEAFLFVLHSKEGRFKAKLTGEPNKAIYHRDNGAPDFGSDLHINDSGVSVQYSGGDEQYEHNLLENISTRKTKPYTIKRVEAYKIVAHERGNFAGVTTKQKDYHSTPTIKIKQATSFTQQINEAFNSKIKSLEAALIEVEQIEALFEEHESFVDSLARSNDFDDMVKLNVCGTTMMTHRSTLRQVKESVLASQFDDSKWTQEGSSMTSPKVWTPSEVEGWVRDLDGIHDNVVEIFEKNAVTGLKLINLGKDELYKLGITCPGSVAIVFEQIENLRKASKDTATIIEHSPYCFGKILSFLRMRRLQSLKMIEDVRCPVVEDSQKERFEKVVQFFFPGCPEADAILGRVSIYEGKAAP